MICFWCSFTNIASAPESWAISSEEIELLSFLHQNIIRTICEEEARQGRPRIDPQVVQAVVWHFNLGPTPTGYSTHWCGGWRIQSEGEFRGSEFMSPHNPQGKGGGGVSCVFQAQGCSEPQFFFHSKFFSGMFPQTNLVFISGGGGAQTPSKSLKGGGLSLQQLNEWTVRI